jgi:hypothetical protein
MKNRRTVLIIIIGITYLFQGCGSIDRTVYLQNISTSGPMNQPPLHITANNDNNTITLSPKILINTTKSLNGQIDGHSMVNKFGAYQVDTIFNGDGTRVFHESGNNTFNFNGNNFNWNLPDAQVGIDFDVKLSRLIAFFGGINYSIIDEERLTGGVLGFGMFADKEHYGNRFDIGVMWQEMFYDASSIVVTNYHSYDGTTTQSVAFYRDKNKFVTYNFFGNWTYNSVNSSLPFDYYFGLGIFGQTVVQFKPTALDMGTFYSSGYSNTDNTDVTTSYLMFMLGIYKNLNDMNRISFGVRVLKEFQIKNLSESLFVIPSIQLDMSF